MTVKAGGRWALILTTGLFVCFAGALRAAESADDAATVAKPEGAADAPIALNKYAKHGSRRLKTYAHHKSGNVALKSADDNKATAADDSASSAAIPPSVANANAQLTSSDTTTGNARAMSIRANDIVQAAPADPPDAQPGAESQVVAADQLNDVDRALHESPPPAVASADAPVAPVAANSNQSSAWDQTSLIGKIFIAFGGLLTLASAARMFMA